MADKKSEDPANKEIAADETGVTVDDDGQVYGTGDGTSADFTGAGADGTVEEEVEEEE